MKVLWLCNIPTPDISEKLGIEPSNGGGWIVSLYNMLVKKSDIELFYIFPFRAGKAASGKAKAEFFGFSLLKGKPTKYNLRLEKIFEDYLLKIKPDIIHIFGTEFAHQLSLTKAAKKVDMADKVVVSIQGLCSYAQRHYTQGLDKKTINSWTFRDFLRKDNIKNQQISFKKRGEFEKQTISNVKHIAGRTTWDKACTIQINKDLKYHHIGETLRSGFYNKSWDIKKCKKHSIFISTAEYPIKGAHYMINALPLIIEKYPETHLYIAGVKLDNLNSFKSKFRLSSYPKYILKLIEEKVLNRNITFLGPLDEDKMIEAFLNANVFASPSVIENSPNSLGEAMKLGLPLVASDVGGVSDMVNHKVDGFIYNSTAEYMLAYFICEIFGDDNLAIEFSKNAKQHAESTHDIDKNFNDVLKLYSDIIK